jgi:hypothetical protein
VSAIAASPPVQSAGASPKWSTYLSKHEVRHFWSCENCGREIEMMVNPRINAALKLSQGVEWSVVA